jgi:uncharacterized repeat protein (TIGR02543 family)
MGDLLLFDGLSDIARWDPVLNAGATTYNVTYDGNTNTGGAVPTDATNYLAADTVTTLDNTGSLTKTAKVFNGWNTAANGTGTARAVGSTWAMGAGNVTLYAQWAVPVVGGNTAARMIVLFGSLVALLLVALLGSSIANGLILRRILAAVTPPRIEVPVNPEIAAAMKDLDYYLDGRDPPKGLTHGPERPPNG